MSHITYDIQLEDAMQELSKLLGDDDPSTYAAVPKGLQEYSSLYVRYIQIYKKLEDCYDQIVHAQKRINLRKTLEACIGRILELKHWMVSLNNGSEYLDFFLILKEMNLGPEALEIPNPRFMPDDNVDALEGKRKFLVRRVVLEYCVFPLASDFVHKNSPYAKSVLLYGGEGNGKTLLVHAACTAAGATFINLSPRNTDGKYPGSQLGKMVQMAFKVAKIMAPSIVYVGDAEMVFVKDKKKLKASGLKDKSSRIKKSLLKEVASLQAGDRVLLIGTSSKPQDAPSKSPSLASLFIKKIYVPYPDYASRVILWRTLLERHGATLMYKFNLSILAHLSVDYSTGSIELICRTVLSKKRLRKLRSHPLVPEELINHFHEFMPVDKAIHAILRKWSRSEPKREDVPNAKK